MLDPVFSTTDLFLRDLGPRRTRVAEPTLEERRNLGPRYVTPDGVSRRR